MFKAGRGRGSRIFKLFVRSLIETLALVPASILVPSNGSTTHDEKL